MKGCPFESRVLSSSPGSELPLELRSHLDACQSCRDSLRLLEMMEEEGVLLRAAANPVPAGAVLWRAARRQQILRGERASRAVRLMEAATILTILVLLAMTVAALGSARWEEALQGASVILIAVTVLAMWLRARLDSAKAL